MNKWRIDIVLKSGKDIAVIYEGDEELAIDVADKLFFGKCSTDIIDFESLPECKQHVFITAGEIAAFGISGYCKED